MQQIKDMHYKLKYARTLRATQVVLNLTRTQIHTSWMLVAVLHWHSRLKQCFSKQIRVKCITISSKIFISFVAMRCVWWYSYLFSSLFTTAFCLHSLIHSLHAFFFVFFFASLSIHFKMQMSFMHFCTYAIAPTDRCIPFHMRVACSNAVHYSWKIIWYASK